MDERFTHLVVPLDLESCGDQSIDVARDLATLGRLPIELVIVLPDTFDLTSGIASLADRAREHRVPEHTAVVLTGNDPAKAVAEHLLTLEAPLVVLATAAHGPVGELLSASASARFMSLVESPVLVVGPRVDDRALPVAPTLLACVGPTGESDPTITVMARWAHSFGGPEPWFVEVLAPNGVPADAGDVRESGLVQCRSEQLAKLGVQSEWEVLHGTDLVDAVERFADGVVEPVLVAESEHWTDPDHLHLHSAARRLAHRGHHPVLVVPHAGRHLDAALAPSRR
ncbi:MAG: universal stress protein [Actinobacteria bacterium]|nr:universal stress protein [Actinomycetota bacterium]